MICLFVGYDRTVSIFSGLGWYMIVDVRTHCSRALIARPCASLGVCVRPATESTPESRQF
jgi:hypothetical protein